MKKLLIALLLCLSAGGFSNALFANEPVDSPLSAVTPEGVVQKGTDFNASMPFASDDGKSALEKRRRFNKLTKSTSQIYKVSMRSEVVYHIQTALGYVSTIDLPETALKVFVGDQELFKVSAYDDQVLIKPITDYSDARTNLTIFTESGRLSFDVSVGSPETTDFVLDFRLLEDDVFVDNAFKKAIDDRQQLLEHQYTEKAKSLAEDRFKTELAKSNKVVKLGDKEKSGDVELQLISLQQMGEKVYLRFMIKNKSKTSYSVSKAVIGIEKYGRKTFGLFKDPQGVAELSSNVRVKTPILAGEQVYGVLEFEPRALGKGEQPIILVFEDGGTRIFKIRDFKWVS